ncbi:MAG: hypothetical protein M1822_004209 [Bathelium mastoideum]|nr:MAG: hypothetical protein M1822_004209 [Bathelium mastoideum]
MDFVAIHIVRDVVNLEVQSSEESPNSIQIADETIHFDGYVDLKWEFEESSRVRCTRFWVVPLEDAPFDVVLGRKSAIEYAKYVKQYEKLRMVRFASGVPIDCPSNSSYDYISENASYQLEAQAGSLKMPNHRSEKHYAYVIIQNELQLARTKAF